MATQKGVFNFTGTIDGVSYYESKYGPLVRRKGGPSSQQVKKDPAFKRARENGKEFGTCGKATKLLRAALRPLLKDAHDFLVTGRLNTMMFAIKNSDMTSARGERNVATGIASSSAKALARGFDFNEQAPLDRVLKKPFKVNTSTGVIRIARLDPRQDLDFPAGATHAKITGGWVKIDFGTKLAELITTNQVSLPMTGKTTNVVLTPVSLPASTGTDLFILQVLFYQEANGTERPVKNGGNNAMRIIEVA